MINWKSIFDQHDEIDPTAAKSLFESRPAGDMLFLDVRQPQEYAEAHIPGARLIPLAELAERLGELEPERQTIVYCRSGVRSKSACQILRSAGFANILNMTGGISAWHGHRAGGPEEMGLELFIAGDYDSAIEMALAMEAGLQQVYLRLADLANTPENQQLLRHMARLEDGHMARLRQRYPTLADSLAPTATVAEGGLAVDTFIDTFAGRLANISDILHVGMLLEAQAYDLYRRLAVREKDAALRQFYLEMAAEEQVHLKHLARELERRLG
ncbi:MAG: rhodanese-like domain-containing protein [Desulfopila sp.]